MVDQMEVLMEVLSVSGWDLVNLGAPRSFLHPARSASVAFIGSMAAGISTRRAPFTLSSAMAAFFLTPFF